MRVLITLGHFFPGYRSGGPAQSIANLVASLSGEFEFRILTRDRDLGDSNPYPGIERDRWTRVGGALVQYCSHDRLGLHGLSRTIRETPHDVLYLNSILSPRVSVGPMVARRLGLVPRRPILVAPRGELSSGALALKPWKKRSYFSIGQRVGLFRDAIWQASSEYEARDIRATLGQNTGAIHIAPDLPTPLPALPPKHTPRIPGEPLRLVFLSRVSPIKNLDFALRVLATVAAPVEFSIYGPPEDAEYAAACGALSAALPPHISVRWYGPVPPQEVSEVFARHDLFFFPTRGENYGHVIAESLGAGTPVLLSDTTPWRGLAAAGVGDDLPLAAPDVFARRIDAAATMEISDALGQRARVAEFARARQRSSADVAANRALFRTAAGLLP